MGNRVSVIRCSPANGRAQTNTLVKILAIVRIKGELNEGGFYNGKPAENRKTLMN